MISESVALFIEPLCISIAFSVCLNFAAIAVARYVRIVDRRTTSRHVHQMHVSRFGGVAIILSFIVALGVHRFLFFDQIVWALIIGGVAILIFGVIDDIHPLNWKSQLFFQISLVLLTFIAGVRIPYITNPFGGVIHLDFFGCSVLCVIFMIVWMLFIMNAVNWCDGIDGLAGGVVVIAAGTLFCLSLTPDVMQPPIAIMAIALCGSVVGFLFFNFPPARIFAGTSGSFFMGFVLAVLAISAGAKIGTTLLVLAVPLVDALWVIIVRLRNGRSIFSGDKEHLHFKLMERGWRTTHILFFYYGITLLCAICALMTRHMEKLFIFVFLSMILLMTFYFFAYDKKTKKSL